MKILILAFAIGSFAVAYAITGTNALIWDILGTFALVTFLFASK